MREFISQVLQRISHLLVCCSPLMSARVLQAVLREAEAVAYCHRIQVWAEREQVCISIFLSMTLVLIVISCVTRFKWIFLIKYLVISFIILFADLVTVYIHIHFDDKVVNISYTVCLPGSICWWNSKHTVPYLMTMNTHNVTTRKRTH